MAQPPADLDGASAQIELLRAILIELRAITAMLQAGLNLADESQSYRDDASALPFP